MSTTEVHPASRAVPGALIEQLVPNPDERTTQHIAVASDPSTRFAAIRTADLLDMPVTRMLSAVAMVPVELVARLHGSTPPPTGSARLADMLTESSPWTLWPVIGPFAALARRGVLQAIRDQAEFTRGRAAESVDRPVAGVSR